MISGNDSPVYGFGVGYGNGYGHGFGDGDGYGDGDDYGYGTGDGFGSGFGDGYGDGYGYSSGYGSGQGLGNGFGYGYGDDSGAGRGDTHSGHLLGIVGEYEVRLVWPGYVRVACLVFSLRDWKENWKGLAEEHEVFSPSELPLASLAVAHLFSLAESANYITGETNA